MIFSAGNPSFENGLHFMRIFTIILISCLCLALERPASREIKWLVLANSKLIIDGKSNVNKFRCQVNEYCGIDTLRILYQPHSLEVVSLAGRIEVQAKSFDCGNEMMTADLRKTILAEKYPQVRIEFLPSQKKKDEKFKDSTAIIQISLGGVCKEFDLNYTLDKTPDGQTVLKGARRFHFSDFNLDPPVKLFGMVKVDDEFEVIFDLVLRPLI